MSVNKAILIGHVGADPTIKNLDNGLSVATFTVATTERGYTLANGTQVPDQTTWHNIVAWRGLAEIAEKWIKKGTQIFIEGRITNRSWEKDGVKRYTTEIVADKIELLSYPKQEGENIPRESRDNATTSRDSADPIGKPAKTPPTQGTLEEPEDKDDLPF